MVNYVREEILAGEQDIEPLIDKLINIRKQNINSEQITDLIDEVFSINNIINKK